MKHLPAIVSSFMIAAASALFSTQASAAVVASAAMTVSANVLPDCAGRTCTGSASAAGTEHVVAVASDTAANPPPTSPLVQQMRVVSY